MKIMYLSTAGFPAEITHTLSMLRVCKALSDLGHQVLITGRRLDQRTDLEVFQYYGMPDQFQLHLCRVGRVVSNRFTRLLEIPGLILAMRFRRALRRFKPDLVYSRLTLAELFAVPKNVPLIYEMHSPGVLADPGWRRKLFLYLMRRLNVRHIVVTTKALRDYLREYLPDLEVRIARLSAELPMDLDAGELAEFRKRELKGSQFEFHAGYTGFLEPVRGIGVVVAAAARSPEVAFHIVGGRPDDVKFWSEQALQQNVPDNVFFYGHRPADEIPWYLRCFDVFLAPLQQPAKVMTFMSPLKIPQYLAYGKPIIASNVLPHFEQLQHEQTALLVAPDDPDEWVAALRRLREDPQLRSRLGANAKALHEAELTPRRRLELILEGIA